METFTRNARRARSSLLFGFQHIFKYLTRSALHSMRASAWLLALTFLSANAAGAQTSLGAYNVNLGLTSVSGISSGAYMAVQFAVAHSSMIKGVGVIAGGPDYCAQDNLDTAYFSCMDGYPAYPTAAPLITTTQNWASKGYIDPVANLALQKVWLFSGYNDGVVKQGVVDALYSYYTYFTAATNVYFKDNLPAAHAQITNSWGQACNQTGGDYINNCGYDAAGQILQHIYGTLNPPNTGTLSGTIQKFDQAAFYSGSINAIGMATSAYAYIPANCAAQQPCTVHVAYHGCLQNAATIGSDYYTHAGYNQWADTNNFIVLYPQTVTTSTGPVNPDGCWDWWGYNAANYAQQSGAQITVVMAMLQHLAGNYTGWSGAPSGNFGAPAGFTADDSSASRVELHWQPVAGATGYNIYRATCASCTFSKLNSAPVGDPSYADSGLAPATTYYYFAQAVNSSGVASSNSTTASIATAATPPVCNPYYRTNYDMWYESRAYVDAIDVDIYANGSNQWLGYTGPLSTVNFSFLRQTSPNYYVPGPCS